MTANPLLYRKSMSSGATPCCWSSGSQPTSSRRRRSPVESRPNWTWVPLSSTIDQAPRRSRFNRVISSPSGISNALRGAALSDLPPPERLARLTMPALVLAWPDDAVHPLANAIALANTLPHAELQVSGSAQDPERWPHTVRRFLMSLNQADQDWTNVPLD